MITIINSILTNTNQDKIQELSTYVSWIVDRFLMEVMDVCFAKIYELEKWGMCLQHSSTGWWFQTWILFSIRYGMSSFPLTFILFKMVKTTDQRMYCMYV